MSLFERISNKIKDDLIIEMNKTGDDDPWDDKDTKTENKKKANQKKKFNKKKELSSNISRTVKVSQDTEGLGNRQSRIDATDPKQGGYSRVDDTIDDLEYKKAKTMGTPTKTIGSMKTYNVNKKNRPPRKGTDYFFDAEKAKKAKDEFRKGRKAYTDSTSGIKAGKVTDKGVIDYITKARNTSQGTNANTKANRKAAKVIAKSSGSEYKEKIRTKYETDKDLSRKRGKNQPSYAEVKKGIDKKNPTYLSPTKTMGIKGDMKNRPLPLSTRKTKTKVKTPPPYKRIETKVTNKEIQDLIKKGQQSTLKPEKIGFGARDKAIKNLDDLIIGAKPGEVEKTKKLLKKQQRIITKKITTPSKKEIEQSQKILDKTQTKPKVTKVKGNLFDPTGRIADETKKANQSFKDFIKKIKTKHPKPKLSLYDPLKTKINVEPLKPLRTFVKPSITKTATKSKGLLPKLAKAVSKNPKAALGVGLLTLGTYGMVKNRKKAPVKNKNKSLVTPTPTKKDEIITRPVSKTFRFGPPRINN